MTFMRPRRPLLQKFFVSLMLSLVLGLPARLSATAGPQEAVELMQQGISKI